MRDHTVTADACTHARVGLEARRCAGPCALPHDSHVEGKVAKLPVERVRAVEQRAPGRPAPAAACALACALARRAAAAFVYASGRRYSIDMVRGKAPAVSQHGFRNAYVIEFITAVGGCAHPWPTRAPCRA